MQQIGQIWYVSALAKSSNLLVQRHNYVLPKGQLRQVRSTSFRGLSPLHQNILEIEFMGHLKSAKHYCPNLLKVIHFFSENFNLKIQVYSAHMDVTPFFDTLKAAS